MDESKLNNFLFETYEYSYKNIEDLGQKKPLNLGAYTKLSIHDYCNTPIHIGKIKLNGKLFKFCPLCKIKLNEN